MRATGKVTTNKRSKIKDHLTDDGIMIPPFFTDNDKLRLTEKGCRQISELTEFADHVPIPIWYFNDERTRSTLVARLQLYKDESLPLDKVYSIQDRPDVDSAPPFWPYNTITYLRPEFKTELLENAVSTRYIPDIIRQACCDCGEKCRSDASCSCWVQHRECCHSFDCPNNVGRRGECVASYLCHTYNDKLGLGVRAGRNIKKGDIILQFTGRVIEQHQRYMQRYEVNLEKEEVTKPGVEGYLDPIPFGGMATFMNDSSTDSNCEAVMLETCNEIIVAIRAVKDISEDDWLTWDYDGTNIDDSSFEFPSVDKDPVRQASSELDIEKEEGDIVKEEDEVTIQSMSRQSSIPVPIPEQCVEPATPPKKVDKFPFTVARVRGEHEFQPTATQGKRVGDKVCCLYIHEISVYQADPELPNPAEMGPFVPKCKKIMGRYDTKKFVRAWMDSFKPKFDEYVLKYKINVEHVTAQSVVCSAHALRITADTVGIGKKKILTVPVLRPSSKKRDRGTPSPQKPDTPVSPEHKKSKFGRPSLDNDNDIDMKVVDPYDEIDPAGVPSASSSQIINQPVFPELHWLSRYQKIEIVHINKFFTTISGKSWGNPDVGYLPTSAVNKCLEYRKENKDRGISRLELRAWMRENYGQYYTIPYLEENKTLVFCVEADSHLLLMVSNWISVQNSTTKTVVITYGILKASDLLHLSKLAQDVVHCMTHDKTTNTTIAFEINLVRSDPASWTEYARVLSHNSFCKCRDHVLILGYILVTGMWNGNVLDLSTNFFNESNPAFIERAREFAFDAMVSLDNYESLKEMKMFTTSEDYVRLMSDVFEQNRRLCTVGFMKEVLLKLSTILNIDKNNLDEWIIKHSSSLSYRLMSNDQVIFHNDDVVIYLAAIGYHLTQSCHYYKESRLFPIVHPAERINEEDLQSPKKEKNDPRINNKLEFFPFWRMGSLYVVIKHCDLNFKKKLLNQEKFEKLDLDQHGTLNLTVITASQDVHDSKDILKYTTNKIGTNRLPNFEMLRIPLRETAKAVEIDFEVLYHAYLFTLSVGIRKIESRYSLVFETKRVRANAKVTNNLENVVDLLLHCLLYCGHSHIPKGSSPSKQNPTSLAPKFKLPIPQKQEIASISLTRKFNLPVPHEIQQQMIKGKTTTFATIENVVIDNQAAESLLPGIWLEDAVIDGHILLMEKCAKAKFNDPSLSYYLPGWKVGLLRSGNFSAAAKAAAHVNDEFIDHKYLSITLNLHIIQPDHWAIYIIDMEAQVGVFYSSSAGYDDDGFTLAREFNRFVESEMLLLRQKKIKIRIVKQNNFPVQFDEISCGLFVEWFYGFVILKRKIRFIPKDIIFLNKTRLHTLDELFSGEIKENDELFETDFSLKLTRSGWRIADKFEAASISKAVPSSEKSITSSEIPTAEQDLIAAKIEPPQSISKPFPLPVRLRPAPPGKEEKDELFVSYGGYDITKGQAYAILYETPTELRPAAKKTERLIDAKKGYLTSDLINIYFQMIEAYFNDKNENIQMFSVSSEGYLSFRNLKNLRTAYRKEKDRFLAADIVLFAINARGDHWVMGIAVRGNEDLWVEVFNSHPGLRDDKNSGNAAVAKQLAEMMKEADKERSRNATLRTWICNNQQQNEIPSQMDSFSCGKFIMEYGRKIADVSPEFFQLTADQGHDEIMKLLQFDKKAMPSVGLRMYEELQNTKID